MLKKTAKISAVFRDKKKEKFKNRQKISKSSFYKRKEVGL